MTRQGHLRPQGHFRRHDAVQDDPSCTAREPAHVVLGDSGAVGDPVEVQLLVPQRLADPLEVSNSHAGREETRVVVERLEASHTCVDHVGDTIGGQKRVVLAGLAQQRRGPTGTPLVDQQDVPLAGNAREGMFRRHVETRRRLARPARNDHERIRRRLFGKRTHDGDEEFDGLAVRITGIQRHLEGPAVGIHLVAAIRCRDVARLEVDLGGVDRRAEHKPPTPSGEDTPETKTRRGRACPAPAAGDGLVPSRCPGNRHVRRRGDTTRVERGDHKGRPYTTPDSRNAATSRSWYPSSARMSSVSCPS